MPGRTNSEKIDGLQANFVHISTTVDNLEEKFTEGIDSLSEQVDVLGTMVHDLRRDNAVLQQRCTTLEKHADRHWQVYLALFSAVVALLVAFLKK